MRFKVRFHQEFPNDHWTAIWRAREDSQQGDTLQTLGSLKMSGAQARALAANLSFMGIEVEVQSDTGKIEGP